MEIRKSRYFLGIRTIIFDENCNSVQIPLHNFDILSDFKNAVTVSISYDESESDDGNFPLRTVVAIKLKDADIQNDFIGRCDSAQSPVQSIEKPQQPFVNMLL